MSTSAARPPRIGCWTSRDFGFLLDTNVPSELISPSPNARVVGWVAAHESLYVSVVSIGEFRRGFGLLANGRRRLHLEQWFKHSLLPLVSGRILPVTEPIASRLGRLSAECRLRGTALNMADGLIAATELEHEMTLVTRNVKDFNHLGVTIFNPWDDGDRVKETR